MWVCPCVCGRAGVLHIHVYLQGAVLGFACVVHCTFVPFASWCPMVLHLCSWVWLQEPECTHTIGALCLES